MMIRVWAALGAVALALAGPALTVAAYDPQPAAIVATDLRGAAGKVRAAVGTWGENAGSACANPPPGAVIMWCAGSADGLTSRP